MTESKYPEHEKLKLIADKSQKIGEFLDWCADEKSIHLTRFDDYHEDGIPVNFMPLLSEFFDIDPDKIEAEKRAMIDEMRAALGDD